MSATTAVPAALDQRSLTDLLARCARRHGVPGAQVAVHHDGRTVAAAFGERESGTGRPVTADTAFPVGSITKAVTATVVLALAADGDLELDEHTGSYVPGLATAADTTIRQLLSHTGGLPCGPAPEQVAGVSVQRYLRHAVRPEFTVLPPGADFSYSNVGYVLLGEVVSSVTGMSWADAIDSMLLRPLGVATDLVGAPEFPRSGRPVATGHSRHARTGRTRPVRQCLVPAEAAAGALALSATDLVAFGRLHVDGGVPEVLPAAYAARMRDVVPGALPFGLARGWGLGLAAFGEAPYDWFGHDGNADGTDCHLRIDPAGGRVVALTTNVGAGSGMWRDLTAELQSRGIPLDDGLPLDDARPVITADCVGTYRNGDLTYEVVPGGPSGLCFSVDGEATEPLALGADLTFYLHDESSDRWTVGGRFVRENRTGRVNAVQVGGRIGRRCVAALI